MEQSLSWDANSHTASQEIHRLYVNRRFITVLTLLGKSKIVPVHNSAPLHEDVKASGGIAPRILNLGARCRWIVIHAPVTSVPGKEPLVRILYEVGWVPESIWTRWTGEENPCPCRDRTPATVSQVHSTFLFSKFSFAGFPKLLNSGDDVARFLSRSVLPVNPLEWGGGRRWCRCIWWLTTVIKAHEH
jgi:hypothetical protein